MTPQQHNRYLGLAHLVYASLFAIFTMTILVLFMFVGIASTRKSGPVVFLFLVWLFIAAVYAALVIPSFVAGYGLLKRKRWARMAAIVGAVVAAMSFPLGTAVCVYTFWFLFSEPGKQLYERESVALPPAPPRWLRKKASNAEVEYIPPATPPDWR